MMVYLIVLISSVPRYRSEASSSLMLVDNSQNFIPCIFDDGCWQRKSAGLAFVEVRGLLGWLITGVQASIATGSESRC